MIETFGLKVIGPYTPASFSIIISKISKTKTRNYQTFEFLSDKTINVSKSHIRLVSNINLSKKMKETISHRERMERVPLISLTFPLLSTDYFCFQMQ